MKRRKDAEDKINNEQQHQAIHTFFVFRLAGRRTVNATGTISSSGTANKQTRQPTNKVLKEEPNQISKLPSKLIMN